MLMGASSSGRASGALLALAESNARQLTDEVLAQSHWMSKQIKELLDGLTGLPHAESRVKPLSATRGVLEAAGTSGVQAGFDAQVIPPDDASMRAPAYRRLSGSTRPNRQGNRESFADQVFGHAGAQ